MYQEKKESFEKNTQRKQAANRHKSEKSSHKDIKSLSAIMFIVDWICDVHFSNHFGLK